MSPEKHPISNQKLFSYAAILAVVLVSWGGVLLVPFINDDYQILGYHISKDLSNVLAPFWQKDISSFYWRPLGNMIHPLMLNICGFSAVCFRIASLLFYSACCIVFYHLAKKMIDSPGAALFAALFFAAAPSHELQVAWIADQGESLVTMFLMLSFISYVRVPDSSRNSAAGYLPALIFLLLAILVKESAFAGILIPVICIAGRGEFSREKIYRAVLHSTAGIVLLCLVLLYRYFVIGGTPFSSEHFSQGGGAFRYLINLAIYIPLTVFPPEFLTATAAYFMQHTWLAVMLLIAIGIIAVLLIYRIFSRRRQGKSSDRYAVVRYAGAILWFLVFISPALPNVMRWYAFTASAGVFWLAGILFSRIRSVRIYYILTAAIVVLCVYNMNVMTRWIENGRRMDVIVSSLGTLKNVAPGDTIFVWGIPDKVNRIPLMKLGVNETFEHATGCRKLQIISPVRGEFSGDRFSISPVSLNDSMLVLESRGGRFISRGEKPAYIPADDDFRKYESEGAEYQISSSASANRSTLSVTNFRKLSGYRQLYFNGTAFEEIR